MHLISDITQKFFGNYKEITGKSPYSFEFFHGKRVGISNAFDTWYKEIPSKLQGKYWGITGKSPYSFE